MANKTIAVQGYEASFHDIAARKCFGDDITLLPCDTFAEVFDALMEGRADNGVTALENSLYGSINAVYDLLLKHTARITGEVFLRIEQCLIGLDAAQLDNIREVHSHPVALAQCEAFLDAMLPNAERFEHHDTAASVADIKRWNDPAKAAIASAAAAELHGMRVLKRGIETNKENYTRFVTLALDPAPITGANKTSLVLTTDHSPGALYRALGAFASRNINLTKLQSRPIIGQAWQYMFYVDVGAAADSEPMQKALDELSEQGCTVNILGSYQAGALQ